MAYSIEQDDSSARASFGEYTYRIYKDGQLVARYWHDYRGDDHEITFISGTKERCPVGRMVDFIEGGGPQPLVLSARAVAYLESRRS